MAWPSLLVALIQRHGHGSIKLDIESALAMKAGRSEWTETIFAAMPSLDLYCEIMTARIVNYSRKEHAGDFYDNLHARVAPAYADIFATTERGIIDLLKNRCSVPRKRGCNIVRGVDALLEAVVAATKLAQQ